MYTMHTLLKRKNKTNFKSIRRDGFVSPESKEKWTENDKSLKVSYWKETERSKMQNWS